MFSTAIIGEILKKGSTRSEVPTSREYAPGCLAATLGGTEVLH